MAPARVGPSTEKSVNFNPDTFFEAWSTSTQVTDDDLEKLMKSSFGLAEDDGFVYHAVASVTLAQVQSAISQGGEWGLHAWYLDPTGTQIPTPPQVDIAAYTAIFSAATSTSKALTGLASNAKKGSIRAGVAAHLASNRKLMPDLVLSRSKAHVNPYLDVWTWSCHNLEWAGPDASTVNVKQSHHVLPIFYHHFGCVCPSFEALQTIKALAKGRPVFDVGSGNGYWTYLMRRNGMTVTAIDNGDSLWRTLWIADTVKMDAAKFLNKENGGKDAVLLLVYPQAGGDFTKSVLASFRGDTFCVAGTQNKNGFTAFGEITIDQYVESHMKAWEKVVQAPLPSFAGKDEALFVFRRRVNAP